MLPRLLKCGRWKPLIFCQSTFSEISARFQNLWRNMTKVCTF
uniref:EFR3-like protein A n=1 Tax=Myotis myotis TaxID=51298 RepID=A0A7J7TI60_MYOMY|nr:EFR3-like protein A [Myotis myotis]